MGALIPYNVIAEYGLETLGANAVAGPSRKIVTPARDSIWGYALVALPRVAKGFKINLSNPAEDFSGRFVLAVTGLHE